MPFKKDFAEARDYVGNKINDAGQSKRGRRIINDITDAGERLLKKVGTGGRCSGRGRHSGKGLNTLNAPPVHFNNAYSVQVDRSKMGGSLSSQAPHTRGYHTMLHLSHPAMSPFLERVTGGGFIPPGYHA